MHTQHCESILCPSLQSPINSVFSLYLNNDRNETISTVINDLTGEEGDERITRACTFLSLLVSFLLSHRSLSFISYNNVLHFPLDTIPQRIMGLLGNLSWWMCACVSVFHLQIFRIIFLSNHLKISKIWGFIWLLDIHVSHRAGVSEGHRKGDAPTL